jgi:hypothetical protein
MATLPVCGARLGLPGDKLSKLSPVIARHRHCEERSDEANLRHCEAQRAEAIPPSQRKSQARPRLHVYTTSAAADLRPAL